MAYFWWYLGFFFSFFFWRLWWGINLYCFFLLSFCFSLVLFYLCVKDTIYNFGFFHELPLNLYLFLKMFLLKLSIFLLAYIKVYKDCNTYTGWGKKNLMISKLYSKIENWVCLFARYKDILKSNKFKFCMHVLIIIGMCNAL